MPYALRVAVADDEPIMQMYLEETVSLLGHEVVGVAKDGAELVELCKQTQPDLIVTDIRMPGYDGYEAIRRIALEHTLPVVFVSGFDESARAETAGTFCVANYLTKPVDENQLSRGIHTVLARFEWYRLLLKEAVDERDALSRLRRVQRAVERLWRREGIKESEGFRRVQDLAESRSVTLSRAADSILAGDTVH